MKRAIFFVLLLAMEHASFSQNLVVNPGFETWGKINKPSGWTTVINCLKDSTNIKSGSYSCKHVAVNSTTKNLGQKLAVIPGNHYKFSFFYKTETIGTEHGCRIWCHWEDVEGNTITDPSTDDILEPSQYMKSDTWQQFSIDIIAPANASFFILEVRTYQNSITYLDDFVFKENVATYKPEEKLSDIKMYPNPAHDYLIISNIQSLQHIDIQSLTGTTLWSSNFSGEKTATIPVSRFPEGLYIINIRTSDKLITRKFIKKAN
jgi:hypothetical protein